MTNWNINMSTQDTKVDHARKIMKTTIKTTFKLAGKTYSWKGNPEGIGLNSEIVGFAKNHDLSIVTHIEELQTTKKYPAWKIVEWAGIYRSYYDSKGKILYVFPIDLNERELR